MRSLFFATTNSHKIKELERCLGLKLESYRDQQSLPAPIEEDGLTFEENAYVKAYKNYEFYQKPLLCEDSGLVVPGLGGQPGIFSARFAGENATDGDNRKKLLKMMEGFRDRKAYYRCVLLLYSKVDERENLVMAEGKVFGTIATEERGESGFGYDPLFVPDGCEKTFAELGEDLKNERSHRKKAAMELKRKLGLLGELGDLQRL